MVIKLINSNDTLLSQLESKGLQTAAQCRQGYCGACRCELIQGDIEYIEPPLAYIATNEVLLCCAVAKSQVEIKV